MNSTYVSMKEGTCCPIENNCLCSGFSAVWFSKRDHILLMLSVLSGGTTAQFKANDDIACSQLQLHAAFAARADVTAALSIVDQLNGAFASLLFEVPSC